MSIRVLFIARYRDATMHRKVFLLGQNKDLVITYIHPSAWHDELLDVRQIDPQLDGIAPYPLSLAGPVTDPHRVFYRTLSFGLKAIQPDIIHAEEEPDSLAGLQVAVARRIFAPHARLILTTWQNINRPKKPHVRLVMQTALGGCDAVCCANQESLDILLQNGYRGKAVLLPPIGVDLRVFDSQEPHRRGDGVIIGYVGRLVQEKGIDVLIKAVHNLCQAQPACPIKLQIMGSGPARAGLQHLVHALEMEGKVEFNPSAPPKQVANILHGLDILVLPSRTTVVWKEQFGRVLVEAMACRVAVIGSDSGAIPEVIGDAGLIFKEGDEIMLAGQLQKLIDTPGLMRELAERGYQRVAQSFTQERIAAQTSSLYHLLVQ